MPGTTGFTWAHSEVAAAWQPREGASEWNLLCQHLDLGLFTLQNSEKQIVVVEATSLWSFVMSAWAKTEANSPSESGVREQDCENCGAEPGRRIPTLFSSPSPKKTAVHDVVHFLTWRSNRKESCLIMLLLCTTWPNVWVPSNFHRSMTQQEGKYQSKQDVKIEANTFQNKLGLTI